ncbi:MAG: nucleotide exchange factor GrpE [Gammaproteobacteria bacterium]|jgi:molecular chaperone GrpE|nr:nucleotide exchange factor GrpE [Gammaproteobacteria bacterium]
MTNNQDNQNAEHQAEPIRFADQLEQLKQELEAAKAKADENWDKALRAVAELENTKRRAEKDISSAHKFAIDRFAESLLPVVDSLEKALEVKADDNEAVQSMHQGVNLTMKMLLDTLQKHGVQQIDPLGETFDPSLHEAMAMQDSSGTEPNKVLVVFQKGYLLNGRLIRPARVIVSK